MEVLTHRIFVHVQMMDVHMRVLQVQLVVLGIVAVIVRGYA